MPRNDEIVPAKKNRINKRGMPHWPAVAPACRGRPERGQYAADGRNRVFLAGSTKSARSFMVSYGPRSIGPDSGTKRPCPTRRGGIPTTLARAVFERGRRNIEPKSHQSRRI